LAFIQRETIKYPQERAQQDSINKRVSAAVLANFNAVGDIKPEYIHVTDLQGTIHTYRILEVIEHKKTCYAGQEQLRFQVHIDTGGLCDRKELIYDIKEHLWWLSSRE
jgi:hypothetical protein